MILPNLVFINGMNLHRGYVNSSSDEICLGIIRGDNANIITYNPIIK